MVVKDRGTALEGFFAHYDGTGNASETIASEIKCRVTLEYELVKKWQIAMHKANRDPKLRGRPLGLLPELYPFDLLKRPLLEQANEFVRQIGTHHWSPIGGVYEFKVWGPFPEKVGQSFDFKPEADNPFIPEHEKKVASTAWLYSGSELPIRFGCAFFIVGTFTREAKYGHVDEQRGLIVV